MMNGWPVTRYQMDQIKKMIGALIATILLIFLGGNTINALIKKRVLVDPKSYTLKDGFPVFHSCEDYIRLIKNYPHRLGVDIRIHRIRKGETLWDIARQNGVRIDTIIAANPFLESLNGTEGLEIVIPREDGVLAALDSFFDGQRMARMLEYTDRIRGDYRAGIFDIFSPDDIRFGFYRKAQPVIVNNNIQRIYTIKKHFKAPLVGYYTSYYGNRSSGHGTEFHRGLDIMGKMGTPVHPARDGMVSSTGWKEGLGKTIVILHNDGYITIYGHLSEIIVKEGEYVKRKEIIGKVGSTGRSSGPHLHFEVKRHGNSIDPILFVW